MRERAIEKRLVERVKAKGGMALKWVSPGHTSVPDRLVFMPVSRLYLVEVKAPGQKQTPLQAHTAEQLAGLGFQVVVLDSLEGVDRWVASL